MTNIIKCAMVIVSNMGEGQRMTLSKAIEIKEAYLRGDLPADPLDEILADRLSIEALKRVKWHKEQHLSGYYEPLPGETEE